MLIDGRRVEFPPAKLAVRTRGGQVLAVLYSDDPPEAIHDSYTGNSFYIEMLLDIADPNELATAHWSFKAPSSDRTDTVTGIYLDGRKRQLQPSDVVVQFDGSTTPLTVVLRGTFLLFEASQDHTIPGRLVPVAGDLEANVTIKGASR